MNRLNVIIRLIISMYNYGNYETLKASSQLFTGRLNVDKLQGCTIELDRRSGLEILSKQVQKHDPQRILKQKPEMILQKNLGNNSLRIVKQNTKMILKHNPETFRRFLK